MTAYDDLMQTDGLTPAQAAAWADAIDVWGVLCLCADISAQHRHAQQVILAEFNDGGVARLPVGVFNKVTKHQAARIYWDAWRAALMAVEWPNPLHGTREARQAPEGQVAA